MLESIVSALSKGSYFGIPWACHGVHLGPSGSKMQIESENEFLGPLGLEDQNVQNGVEKESQKSSHPCSGQKFS